MLTITLLVAMEVIGVVDVDSDKNDGFRTNDGVGDSMVHCGWCGCGCQAERFPTNTNASVATVP